MAKTKFAIIISKKDEAGMNIACELKKLNIGFIEVGKESIYADGEVGDKCRDADFVIFATKHESSSKKRTLTVHVPGNWNKAELGGVAGKVCKTSGIFLKLLFNILNKEADENGLTEKYNVSLEATHHGPLIEKPCCFIEIGSSEKDWQDKQAGRVIARTIKKAVENFENLNENWISVIGVGGPHYCPNFSKIQLNSKYAIGHIIPEYCLPLTRQMVKEVVEKSVEKVENVIIDWKGCGVSEERQKMIDLLEGEGLKVLRGDRV